MTTEMERLNYRRRLAKGDLVYFVGLENIYDTHGTGDLTIKKATVESVSGPGGWERHYPFVKVWDGPLEEPHKAVGLVTSKSPRALFTSEEIESIIQNHEGDMPLDGRAIDEIILDPVASKELVVALGGATFQRLADDEARNPGDPEF